MLIDDWASVGTSNLDVRSFRHDFEVVIVLTRDASTESLASQFKKDIERAEEISFEQWLARPLLKRLAERIALLLRYWL
jgi:cardiolipin synthase